MLFTNRGQIIRTCSNTFSDYTKYKSNLAEDFYHRCAYCDTRDNIITTPFEADHFIPRDAFKNIKDELDYDYNNLIYSCKKCNIAKGSKFVGNINSTNPTNELFYDPTKTDYNDIFYRNEIGIIVSDDPKGKNMIAQLRLYRPIHALAWIIGQANETIDFLEERINKTDDTEIKAKLNEVLTKLINYTYKNQRIFTANYNSKNDFN